MNHSGLKRVQANAGWILLALVVTGWLYRGPGTAVSVLIGGLLAFLNHHWMVGGIDAVLGSPTSAGRRQVLVKYLLRVLLILGTLFAMIHFSFLSLFGGILGLSVLVLAGMLEALIQLIEQLKRSH